MDTGVELEVASAVRVAEGAGVGLRADVSVGAVVASAVGSGVGVMGARQPARIRPALRHAWRQVELDPWREEAHQQIMRLLALSGRHSEALAQYETCRRLLAEEMGIGPATKTTGLYEQIRDGEMRLGVEGDRAVEIARRQGAKSFVGRGGG